jgi:chromosome segregation ATPase
MSGQGYDELKLLNRKIDELVNSYSNLKHECENLKTEKEAMKAALQDRETEMKEL